jgi:hypothetical protein
MASSAPQPAGSDFATIWRFVNQPLVVLLLSGCVAGIWNISRLLDDSVKFQRDFAKRLETLERRVTQVEDTQQENAARTDRRLSLLEVRGR